MAFAKGNETFDGPIIKKYIGVAPVNIVAINPTKEELEKIYNRQINEVTYTNEVDGKDGNKVKQIRIDFIVETVSEDCNNISILNKISFFINDEKFYNKDKSKVKVIDAYGRTAWVTIDELNEHKVPMYSNGPANISDNYRPLYIGEENLTSFIRTYLCIPDTRAFNNDTKTYYEKTGEELAACEGILEKIQDYFSGNVSEIKEYISYQPKNKIDVLFGIRNSNGSQYQTIYNNYFVKAYKVKAGDKEAFDKKYKKLSMDLQDRKNAGAYANTDFEVCPIKEYEIVPTDFNKVNDSENAVFPFGNDEMPF